MKVGLDLAQSRLLSICVRSGSGRRLPREIWPPRRREEGAGVKDQREREREIMHNERRRSRCGFPPAVILGS